MFYISILIILLLIGFLALQRITIHKYKELSIYEKSFLASLTHDIKSPTRAQINMLNLLLKGYFGKLNPQQYEMIKLTCNSSQYVSNLAGTILAGYKYENSAILLNKKYFDITKLINDVIKENECLISDKNLNVVFPSWNMQCQIFADELQIRRVIVNLLSNAINYSINGTNIIIRLDYSKEYTKFSMSNKCKPISNNEIKNIFNKFSKTKISEQNKYSTGLGLFTAKKIINMHKGSISAECTPNGIFTISFRLNINYSKNKPDIEIVK